MVIRRVIYLVRMIMRSVKIVIIVVQIITANKVFINIQIVVMMVRTGSELVRMVIGRVKIVGIVFTMVIRRLKMVIKMVKTVLLLGFLGGHHCKKKIIHNRILTS